MVYSINGLIGHVLNERGIGTTYDRKCSRNRFEGQKTEGGQQATYPYVPVCQDLKEFFSSEDRYFLETSRAEKQKEEKLQLLFPWKKAIVSLPEMWSILREETDVQ